MRVMCVTAAALAAVGLAVAGCGGSGGSSTGASGRSEDFDLNIATLTTLTGDSAAFGPAARKASEMAVKEANAALREAGLGVTVTNRTYDTEGTSQGAQQAARKAIADGATCFNGPFLSSDVITMSQSIIKQQPVPMVAPGSTNATISTLDDDGYIHRVVPSDTLQATALADAIERELGGTPLVAVGARNEAYGTGISKAFVEAWEARGGRVSGPVIWDPNQPSFDSEAQALVEDGPAAFAIFDFPETFAKVGAALLRTGRYDASKTFVTDALAADRIPAGIPPAALSGAHGTRPAAPETGATVDAFNALWDETDDVAHYTFDAQAFDATMLCVLAAVAAGSDDPEAIRDQLARISGGPGERVDFRDLAGAFRALADGRPIDFDGVSGPIEFDANGDPTIGTYQLWTYRPDGALEGLRSFKVQQG
jgi:ABC-type branched-subunit amino acid transport system substrate-binding protein